MGEGARGTNLETQIGKDSQGRSDKVNHRDAGRDSQGRSGKDSKRRSDKETLRDGGREALREDGKDSKRRSGKVNHRDAGKGKPSASAAGHSKGKKVQAVAAAASQCHF